MTHIKKYSDFIQETDVVGHDEPMATKPTALSEALCEKLGQCMEMAMAEAKAWHDDEHKEHTAESYGSECNSYMKEMMTEIQKTCEALMTQGTHERPDGGMRQGSVQDVPAMSGAVR
jgi:hypothetical protein